MASYSVFRLADEYCFQSSSEDRQTAITKALKLLNRHVQCVIIALQPEKDETGKAIGIPGTQGCDYMITSTGSTGEFFVE